MSSRNRRLVIRIAACVLISVALTGFTAAVASANRLGRFEGIAYDLAFPRGDLDDSVAVVAIDDKALKEVDATWPWSRSLHADLVDRLSAAGARLIVFDVVFDSDQPDDPALAESMRAAGNVVLGASALSPNDAPESPTASGVRQTELVPPNAMLSEAAFAVAHTQVLYDETDGVVREIPLVLEDQTRQIVPALSLAALGGEQGEPVNPIMRRPSGVQAGDRAVPTNDRYDFKVSYAPELDSFQTGGDILSAADVVNGRADADALRDKVVFIGVTDVSLGDRVLTPVNKSVGLPGVLVQANAFNTIATRTYIAEASTLEIAMCVLLVTLILTFAVQFLPAWMAGLVSVATLAAYAFTAYFRADAGTVMNFTYPTIAVALAVPLSGAVRYFIETRQRRRVNALFSQYVPERVATQLIDEGDVGRVAEGQRVDVTAMFCDLRGFTTLSSSLAPMQVNTMLSEFYEYGTRLVLDYDGTVMTYIGDEIFAIFGAPVPSDRNAANALECAKRLQEHIDELDSMLAKRDFAPLRFGIGLHAGEVVASHAGSTWRRQYTAIGDTVNVAARLCGQAGPGQVVLSETVRAQVDPAPCVEPLGSRDMKGVSVDFLAWKLILERTPSGTHDR
jgi:adenylate cyclase